MNYMNYKKLISLWFMSICLEHFVVYKIIASTCFLILDFLQLSARGTLKIETKTKFNSKVTSSKLEIPFIRVRYRVSNSNLFERNLLTRD